MILPRISIFYKKQSVLNSGQITQSVLSADFLDGLVNGNETCQNAPSAFGFRVGNLDIAEREGCLDLLK